MDAEDLDGHNGPVFRSGNVGDSETWPTDDIGVPDVFVSVDPFLQAEIFASRVLVDVDVGGEKLVLVVRRHEHLSLVSKYSSRGFLAMRGEGV